MRFSEEQVKEIVALRENMLKQIDKHQEGIEMLEKNIIVLTEEKKATMVSNLLVLLCRLVWW